MVHPVFPEDHGFISQHPAHRFHQEDLAVRDMLHSNRWAAKQHGAPQDSAAGSTIHVSTEEIDSDDDCWGAWKPQPASAATASTEGGPPPSVRPPGMPAMDGTAPQSAGSSSGHAPLVAMSEQAGLLDVDAHDPWDEGIALNTMVGVKIHPAEAVGSDDGRAPFTPELLDILSVRAQAKAWTTHREGGQAECIILSYAVQGKRLGDTRRMGPKGSIALMFLTAGFARKVLDLEAFLIFSFLLQG